MMDSTFIPFLFQSKTYGIGWHTLKADVREKNHSFRNAWKPVQRNSPHWRTYADSSLSSLPGIRHARLTIHVNRRGVDCSLSNLTILDAVVSMGCGKSHLANPLRETVYAENQKA